jgi:hypothetical protein
VQHRFSMTGLTEELFLLLRFGEAYTDRMHPRLFLLIGLLLCQPCWGQKRIRLLSGFCTVWARSSARLNPTSSEG